MLEWLSVRRNLILATATCAAALGAGGWLLLGPLWTIAGVAAGCLVSMFVYISAFTYSASPATLIARGRPADALRRLQREEPTTRRTAQAWPSQFAEVLAHDLLVKSDALGALHHDTQALRSAEEGVAIFQTLAAEEPAKYARHLEHALHTQSHRMIGVGQLAEAIEATQTSIRLLRNLAIAEPDEKLPRLAHVLTCMAGWLADIDETAQALEAAHEATSIYWREPPSSDLPAQAARAALLEGRLLCQEARYHDAARLLARGWKLATRHHLDSELSDATPSLATAYRADPDDFATIWQAETGSRPPGWLTTT
jgi:tetratricopeptide (TPR) repeat protein